MWLPVALLLYAAAGAGGGAAALRWRGWDTRAPRLALVAWQAALVSVTGAALIGLLTLSHHGWETLLTGLLHADYRAVHLAYQLPEVPAATLLAAVAGAGLLARLAWALTTTARRVRHLRQRHRALLGVLARPAPPHRPGGTVSVVEADRPTVYCLPGPQSRTVVTTAALRVLTPEQVAAAVAHERAHLRFRHHWLLTWGAALRVAFAPLPLFAGFQDAAARLVEMAADDEAGRRHGRANTAAALLALSGPAPAGTVPAAPITVERIERLVNPPPAQRRLLVAIIAVAAIVVLALPAVIALTPGLGVMGSAH